MIYSDDFPMMLEVEIDPQTQQPRNNCPPVSVGFGLQPHQDSKKTAAAGHAVFIDMEYVKIAVPGERNSLYFQPATDQHKFRFPRAYTNFKTRLPDEKIEGLPVEQWAAITRSQALTLRAAHIPTVEALAAVHDHNVDRLGFNARELRARAQAFLEQATKGAAALKVASEKEALSRELEGMRAQMASLLNLIPADVKAKLEKQAKVATTSVPIAEEADDVEADVAKAVRKPRRAA